MPSPDPSLNVSPADLSIDELMEATTSALMETRYFDAERIACEALAQARRGERFERMARIVLPLQEARRQRLDRAFEAAARCPRSAGHPRVVRPQLDSAEFAASSGARLEAGAWLVQPPMVGADARRLRCAAAEGEIPVAVLCREPTTKNGGCPLVAVGAAVFRTIVEPPSDPEAPDMPWFIRGMEALGDAAIEVAMQERDPIRQIDALLDALDAHPDHEKLHQVLERSCRIAAAVTRRPTRSPQPTQPTQPTQPGQPGQPSQSSPRR